MREQGVDHIAFGGHIYEKKYVSTELQNNCTMCCAFCWEDSFDPWCEITGSILEDYWDKKHFAISEDCPWEKEGDQRKVVKYLEIKKIK